MERTRDEHDELSEEIGGLKVLACGPETPKLHPSEDRFVRDNWCRSPQIQRFRETEEHDDKHREVEDRGQVVAPPRQLRTKFGETR
jgi:hypothetical protein